MHDQINITEEVVALDGPGATGWGMQRGRCWTPPLHEPLLRQSGLIWMGLDSPLWLRLPASSVTITR